ncbi:hypothetical protein FB595_108155 [Sphingobium sp. AEW010]|uniref:hypothetical protein n=1 Tax=unclassified Sphingobium TaxID=2611147 RepID=UPI00119A8B6C|nr:MULTISPECIES: hypothetical protein [unclassified Sphingobium]MBG6120600.1 hypothetical protein [Sphingobium sp. JAI105]TWD06707.1 hypothetical protein FB595_108155 [Sphingobium sp. AEW010]TWD23640.1 hypothetical protein FB596_108155 [Sphingobium sp. AEW013]TWD26159.1 hypothetical protein FB594_108155 [Sphingobium sp. AEW001]
MTKSISEDLRSRVILAVDGGLSRRGSRAFWSCGGERGSLGSRMGRDRIDTGEAAGRRHAVTAD